MTDVKSRVMGSFSAANRKAKLDAAESGALGIKPKTTPKPAAKPKGKAYAPPAKGVQSRQAKIDAARKADEAAIAAMKKRKK